MTASKASGASIDFCEAHVWTLHDRKPWRIGVYLDRDDEPLEAAGLSE